MDMRTLMNKVKLAEDANFKKDILKTFRKKLSESHNVKLSATRTAKTFGIDVNDVVFIVREAKEKVMEDALDTSYGADGSSVTYGNHNATYGQVEDDYNTGMGQQDDPKSPSMDTLSEDMPSYQDPNDSNAPRSDSTEEGDPAGTVQPMDEDMYGTGADEEKAMAPIQPLGGTGAAPDPTIDNSADNRGGFGTSGTYSSSKWASD